MLSQVEKKRERDTGINYRQRVINVLSRMAVICKHSRSARHQYKEN